MPSRLLSYIIAIWLCLRYPVSGIAIPTATLAKRAFSVNPHVAIAALAAIGGACSTSTWKNCFTSIIGAAAIVIISGYTPGLVSVQGEGSPLIPPTSRSLLDRSSAPRMIDTVKHHLPNGTMLQGFHPYLLDVGAYHAVNVGDNYVLSARRLESGHVHIRGKIDQALPPLTRLAHKLSMRTDDDPGDTEFIDVFYNDDNIGGTGLEDDGGEDELSNQIATDVSNTFTDNNAETVCASVVNPETNGEVFTTEWVIKAGDGTEGSTPSGACDDAQGKRIRLARG